MKKIKQVVREADATVRESRETGAPLDEVFEMRAERHAERVAASQPVVEDYNEAAAQVRERGTVEDRLAALAAMEDLNHLGSGRRVDRRTFFKGAGTAAAGLAALSVGGSTILQAARANAATAAPRIAIIGGGLAGLRTAQKLWVERGIKSTIYEANAEIGGRCHTERGFFLDNQIVEPHGEFVNSEHYAVKALAARYGLGMEDLNNNYPMGTEDTHWIDNSRYTEWEVTEDWKAFGYNAFHDAVLKAEAPQTYDNHNAQAVIWDKMNVPTFVNSLPGMSGTRLAKLAIESAQGEWGPPGDVSGLGMLWQWAYNTSKKTAHSYQSKSYLWSEGGDARWHVQGGSDGLVTGMVGELPAGTIKTNSPVTAIVKNAGGTYKLSVKAGSKTTTVTVDHVVIAAPFTSLRANVNLTKAGISTPEDDRHQEPRHDNAWEGRVAVQWPPLVPVQQFVRSGRLPSGLVVGSELPDEQQHITEGHPGSHHHRWGHGAVRLPVRHDRPRGNGASRCGRRDPPGARYVLRARGQCGLQREGVVPLRLQRSVGEGRVAVLEARPGHRVLRDRGEARREYPLRR